VRRVPAACAAAVMALLSVIAWSGASHVSQPMAVCGYSCITVLSAALVLKGGLDGGARLLTSRWLGSFGKYSYGIYVWHALIWIKSASLLRQYRSAFPAWVLVPVAILGGVAASWVIARVSWYLIESPCAKVKERYFKTAEPNGDIHC
jgi:peptidoglycan/LPS O-acetylase OafA/YrhL